MSEYKPSFGGGLVGASTPMSGNTALNKPVASTPPEIGDTIRIALLPYGMQIMQEGYIPIDGSVVIETTVSALKKAKLVIE